MLLNFVKLNYVKRWWSLSYLDAMGDEAARGVACTIDKANNLTNLHCIQRETKPTCARLATAAVCSDRSWMQMSVRYITQATPTYIRKLLDNGIAVFSNVHHAATRS